MLAEDGETPLKADATDEIPLKSLTVVAQQVKNEWGASRRQALQRLNVRLMQWTDQRWESQDHFWGGKTMESISKSEGESALGALEALLDAALEVAPESENFGMAEQVGWRSFCSSMHEAV